MGHANVTGHGAHARRHLAQVNGWSASQVERYVELAFAVWQRRSQHEWQLDISALDAYGVAPAAPDSDPAGGLADPPRSASRKRSTCCATLARID